MHQQIFEHLLLLEQLPANIYLVGMPASGKSTFGKKLANLLNYSFIDLDSAIEEGEQQSISDIFEQKGEAFFRKLETQYLKKTKSKKQVIATGGGTPCHHTNMDWMNENGTTIWLDAPLNLLVSRAKQSNNRPLFNQLTADELKHKISLMLDERTTFYAQSHMVFVVKFC